MTSTTNADEIHIVRVRENDDEVLTIKSDNENAANAVLSAFGVDSVDALAQQELSSYERRKLGEQRLGVIVSDGDNESFHSETDLLSRVEGISEGLAAGLIDGHGDIPSLCEEYRRDGEGFLGTVLNDAEVDDQEWAGELRTFCESIDQGEFEKRLKDAGIWVEPDNMVAH